MKNFPIITTLKHPTYFFVFLGTTFLWFDLSYYLMKSLPGSRNNMCVEGANLTTSNILFSILASVLIGMFVAGMIRLIVLKTVQNKLLLSSFSGLGVFSGIFTIFCPLCSLPALSFLGISMGLEFFTEYNLLFKIGSILLLFLSLYFLQKQLQEKCLVCALSQK